MPSGDKWKLPISLSLSATLIVFWECVDKEECVDTSCLSLSRHLSLFDHSGVGLSHGASQSLENMYLGFEVFDVPVDLGKCPVVMGNYFNVLDVCVECIECFLDILDQGEPLAFLLL